MNSDLIIVEEYCQRCQIEPSFIVLLNDEGLIQTVIHDDVVYIPISQLKSVDRFRKLYYDLEINLEGLDVIDRLLGRIETMQREMRILRKQYRLLQR